MFYYFDQSLLSQLTLKLRLKYTILVLTFPSNILCLCKCPPFELMNNEINNTNNMSPLSFINTSVSKYVTSMFMMLISAPFPIYYSAGILIPFLAIHTIFFLGSFISFTTYFVGI